MYSHSITLGCLLPEKYSQLIDMTNIILCVWSQFHFACANFKEKYVLIFFVCLGFIIPVDNFSHIWNIHHCRWRVAIFDLCLALMIIEELGFLIVQHLLWQGTSVYNGHIRGPMTLTPIAERLAVELSLPVFAT